MVYSAGLPSSSSQDHEPQQPGQQSPVATECTDCGHDDVLSDSRLIVEAEILAAELARSECVRKLAQARNEQL